MTIIMGDKNGGVRGSKLLLWFGLCLSLFSRLSSHGVEAAPSMGSVSSSLDARQQNDNHKWVATWTSMPQLVEPNNLPPLVFGRSPVFRNATLRQTLHMSIGASRIRVQISNTFSLSDLPIAAASLALPTGGKAGVGSIVTSTLKPLTFNDGKASVVVARGQTVYSDPVDFTVATQSMLTVSLYLQSGQLGTSITGHPGSRTTSWIQSGNHVNSDNITGSSTKHWYFISAVDAWSPSDHGALVILGDSITDGRGSTDDANNRWPDLLMAPMYAQGGNLTKISVVNQAAGGNAVLSGGLGPTLLTRYKRDALQVAGVKYVMLFEGVNDIGNAGSDVSGRLQEAFRRIAADCRNAGLVVFAATITPFGGQGQSYSNPAREQMRTRFNRWILSSTPTTFDAVIDFAKMIANPSDPTKLASVYDGGDHLHPNVAGYQRLADQFPLSIFNSSPRSPRKH